MLFINNGLYKKGYYKFLLCYIFIKVISKKRKNGQKKCPKKKKSSGLNLKICKMRFY